LNLNTAPVIYHFPAKGSPKKHDQMDFQRSGFGAEAIAKFVQDRTEVNIRVLRPPNFAGPVVVILLIMLILGLLYMRRDNLDFVYSKNFWGAAVVIATIAFTSGQVWNHIRSPPFLMTHPQTKETTFIHGSTQYQLVAETYLVFTVYALISIGMVFLNDFVQSKGDASSRRCKLKKIIHLAIVFTKIFLFSDGLSRYRACRYLLFLIVEYFP
jgi:oligosaccharyltransferase complex subunit gamma